MYAPLQPLVRQLLAQRGVTITFVDVGARGGIVDLGAIGEFVDAYGFEPNPVEYEKLAADGGTADRTGPYRSVRYYPWALAGEDGTADLHVTRAPGAASLLEPNLERLSEITWKDGFVEPDYSAIFAVERVIQIPTRTLDALGAEANVSHVDYLKLDVEGAEYDVLAGGRALLSTVGVVRCEVSFIPFHLGERVFSEVDLLLREKGFDLLRYEVRPTHIGYKERHGAAVFGPEIGYADPFGQPLQADAVYVNRKIADPVRAIAQAAVLADRNYLDEALFILRRRAGLSEGELTAFLRTYQDVTFATRLFRTSLGAVRAARRVRRSLHSLRRR